MFSSRSIAALAFLATAYTALPSRATTLAAASLAQPRAGACDSAQAQKAAGPSAGNVTPLDVCHLLSALADDSMEGRGTGTLGGAKAARFIAEQMRAAGLEPAGDSGFFQRVPLAYATRTGPDGRVQRRAIAVASFADRDTFPADKRGLAVNVVGILPGSDPVLKDSVVLVDAHYDHLGLRAQGPAKADSARMDSIYNGADDDASGTVAVLEIAKQLAAGPRPKRTIVFAATTGEEVGLIGTRWYIAHPARPLASMEANLEIEMIGRPDHSPAARDTPGSPASSARRWAPRSRLPDCRWCRISGSINNSFSAATTSPSREWEFRRTRCRRTTCTPTITR